MLPLPLERRPTTATAELHQADGAQSGEHQRTRLGHRDIGKRPIEEVLGADPIHRRMGHQREEVGIRRVVAQQPDRVDRRRPLGITGNGERLAGNDAGQSIKRRSAVRMSAPALLVIARLSVPELTRIPRPVPVCKIYPLLVIVALPVTVTGTVEPPSVSEPVLVTTPV